MYIYTYICIILCMYIYRYIHNSVYVCIYICIDTCFDACNDNAHYVYIFLQIDILQMYTQAMYHPLPRIRCPRILWSFYCPVEPRAQWPVMGHAATLWQSNSLTWKWLWKSANHHESHMGNPWLREMTRVSRIFTSYNSRFTGMEWKISWI